MIGVAKNQNVRKFESRSRTSRKCTVSAESSSARPTVKTSWTATTTGNQRSSSRLTPLWKPTLNAARITSPKQKCTIVASTLTIGSTSAGKSTFLIRLPPATSDTADSLSDVANHVHGNRPQNRNTGYGVSSGSLAG